VDVAIADPVELDVVVNNAGFEVQSAWSWSTTISFVNVSSIAGVVAVPYGGAYAASKHALEAMTEALHYETAAFGLRFALIEPGRFETDFHSNVVSPAGWEESLYHERAMRYRRAALLTLGADGAQDPQLVADAIIAAATDPSTPLCTLVGGDAQLIATVRAQGDFEQFEATMRSALDWDD